MVQQTTAFFRRTTGVDLMTKVRRFLGNLNSYFLAGIYYRLLPYVRPYKLPMAIVILVQIIYTVLGLLEPWPMKILIDSGLSGQPLPGWFKRVFPFLRSEKVYAIVVFAVLGGFILKLIMNVLDIIGKYLKERINSGMILSFRADMFNHLQRLSLSYHDQTTVGDSIYRINNDTSFVSTLVWGNFRHLLTSVLRLVGILWIVVKLDWLLALLAVAVAPIQYISIGFYSKLFRAKSMRVRGMESAVQTIIQEVLSCLRVVKAFGREESEQQRLEGQAWAALRGRLRLEFQRDLFSQGLRFVSRLDRTLILLVGAFHVLGGQLTIGELLVILSYASQIHDPIEEIGHVFTDMQNSLISAERAVEILDLQPDIKDRPGAKTLHRVQGAVAFEDVSFAYRTGHPALRQLSFTVRPGDVVALVGPTGAGKTTAVSLLIRFYDPESGRVTLDGHDLRDLTVRTLRDNIALVLQEPILFSGSIRENIAYGRPDAHLGEIVAAAKTANAHEFIIALPDGYESQVGERGVRLSGGERQRIAIARAFLKDARVLILDEPTSLIDSHTERVILDALERLMVGRTTFIIAHRLSTVRRADQILVMDKGRVVEGGTHDELVLRNNVYAKLYRIQSGTMERRKKAEAGMNTHRDMAAWESS